MAQHCYKAFDQSPLLYHEKVTYLGPTTPTVSPLGNGVETVSRWKEADVHCNLLDRINIPSRTQGMLKR